MYTDWQRVMDLQKCPWMKLKQTIYKTVRPTTATWTMRKMEENHQCKGPSRIVIVFKNFRVRWPPYAFLNVDYDSLHFHTGSLKINIFEVLFWEEGRRSQKRVSVYAFDNVDNYGKPLRLMRMMRWQGSR